MQKILRNLNKICTLVDNTVSFVSFLFLWFFTTQYFSIFSELNQKFQASFNFFFQMTKTKFSRLLAVILDDKTYENKSKILLNINRNLALYPYYIKQVESKCHNFLNEAKIHNCLKYIYIYIYVYVLCIQKLLYCA